MYEYGRAFAQAVETRMAWELLQSGNPSRRQLHNRMYEEFVEVVSGEADMPTPFQVRMRKQIEEYTQMCEELIDAATAEPRDDERARSAATQVLANAFANTLSLEMRVSLIERVLDTR